MLHTPIFSGMIAVVGKRPKDVPVRLEIDLKKTVVELAEIHDLEQKKLLSRLVRWFDRQPELVQKLIVARKWTGTEPAIEQMIIQMLDDFRAGKLTKTPDGTFQIRNVKLPELEEQDKGLDAQSREPGRSPPPKRKRDKNGMP